MKKSIKIILILLGAGIIIGGGAIYWVFNKPHRNIEKEKAEFVMTAPELFSEYSENEDAGNTKFISKVIQVSGEIVEINKDGNDITVVLGDAMEGVSCALDSAAVVNGKEQIAKLEEGQTATLKGKCDGIDMIMGVVLTRCYFAEESEK